MGVRGALGAALLLGTVMLALARARPARHLRGLFLIGSDGANKRQITDTPRAFEYEPDWQPVPGATPQSGSD